MRPDQPPKPSQNPQSNLGPKTSVNEGGLPNEQMAALRKSAIMGEKIKEACPEIAADYLIKKLTQDQLVEKYNIQERFGISNKKIARNSVRNALVGYSGGFGKPYLGLITNPEMLAVAAKEHRKSASKKAGDHAKSEGTGIFGMTEEEKRERNIRAGESAYKSKKGIHAQTFEETREAGKASVIRRGFTPFSNEEETFLRELDLTSEQYRTRGIKINLKKIAKEINLRFHDKDGIKRTGSSIKNFLAGIKKQNASKIESK